MVLEQQLYDLILLGNLRLPTIGDVTMINKKLRIAETGDDLKGETQYLYALSDKKPQVREWVYSSRLGRVVRFESDMHHCKLIVATNNPRLWINDEYAYGDDYREYVRYNGYNGLPWFHEDFLEAYIECHNQGDPITKIYLEDQEDGRLKTEENTVIVRLPLENPATTFSLAQVQRLTRQAFHSGCIICADEIDEDRCYDHWANQHLPKK